MSAKVEQMRYGEVSPDTVIWRYFTRTKIESFLRTRALWFSKLTELEDQYEGRAPRRTRELIERKCREMATWFPSPEHQRQVLNSFERNEQDGREVLVVSCWTTNAPEDPSMWEQYAPGPDSIAIQTTVGLLADSMPVCHDQWWVGHITYIDTESDDRLSSHEGHQAHIRAFLKNAERFAHEREVRVCTMNYVTPGMLNPDGSPQTERQRSGLVYDTSRRGILATIPMTPLIRAVASAPNATHAVHVANLQLFEQAGVTLDKRNVQHLC